MVYSRVSVAFGRFRRVSEPFGLILKPPKASAINTYLRAVSLFAKRTLINITLE
jgi:hypothetical protein